MRVLVTGATGFVGSHFLEHVAKAHPDWTVIASGNEEPAQERIASDYVQADLCLAEDTRRLLEVARADAIVHLAGLTRGSPEELWQANVSATRNLLNKFGETSDGASARVVMASSAAVYGAMEADHLPTPEGTGMKPTSPYAISKAAQELAGQSASLDGSFELVRARIFNLVGPRQPGHLVPAVFIRGLQDCLQGERRLTVGDLSSTRDFVDVRDVAKALCLLLRKGDVGAAYNVASGQERSIGSVLESVLRIGGWEDSVQVEERLQSGGRSSRSWASVEAVQQLGWTPDIPFEQSLKEMIQ